MKLFIYAEGNNENDLAESAQAAIDDFAERGIPYNHQQSGSDYYEYWTTIPQENFDEAVKRIIQENRP